MLVFLILVLACFGLIVLSQLRQRIAMEREIRSAHKTMRDMALTDSLPAWAIAVVWTRRWRTRFAWPVVRVRRCR